MIEVLATGGKWFFMNIASYAFRKGMDKIFTSEKDLANELKNIIDQTINEYAEQYPQPDVAGMYAFYNSHRVVEGLLQYRIMHPDDYNAETLFDTFNQDSKVIPPTLVQIKNFYNIFTQKIEEHPKLKSIEIKNTFQEEVFVISSKLDNLNRKIEYILQVSNADLELQWKDRIDTYVATLKAFKPQTALDLLVALENSFALGTKRPSKEFNAAINYQKGICYQFLGNVDKSSKSFIIAYSLNQSIQSYKEKAALAYYRLSEKEQAKRLSEELLKDNPYNPIACSIFVLISDDIEVAINEIPSIVYKDILFQSILWHDFAPDYTRTKILEDKSIIPQRSDIPILDVDIDNFDQIVFYVEILLTDFIRRYNYVGFIKLEYIDNELFVLLEKLFDKLLGKLKNTEIESKLYMLFFYDELTKYILTSNKKCVLQMKEFYQKGFSDDILFCSLCANCLQIEGYIDFALEVIDREKSTNFELLNLKVFCYLRKNDIDNYVKYIKEGISSLMMVNERIHDIYLTLIISLKSSCNFENIEPDFFSKDKNFENENIKRLIEIGSNCLKKSSISESEHDELKQLTEIFKDYKNPSLFIANIYFFCEDYEKAVSIYENHIDTEQERRELLFYITSLEKLNIGSSKLIYLLEKWRKNYIYDEQLLRLEANLHSAALDWDKCIEISDYVLNKDPNNDAFLVLRMLSADRLNNEKILDDTISKYIKLNKYECHIPNVIEILNRHGYLDESVDILYQCIERDKENTTLLMLYMNTCLKYSGQKKSKFQEFKEIQEECFVKYQINKNIKFAEIKGNNSNGMFRDKKLGDTFTHGSYTISILRIMDKYLYLHDLIFQKVYEMPPELSGLPMESFSIDSSNPESFLGLLKDKFGDTEKERHDSIQQLLEDYYAQKVSYTEIIQNICDGDYLAGYFYLAHIMSGIIIIPTEFFNQFNYPTKPQYIIDLSTLPILFQIANKYNIKYPEKLYISKYHVEVLRRTLNKIQVDLTSSLSIVVTKESVTKINTSANAKENDIDYLTKLIDWVNENCIKVIEPDSLDLKRALQDKDIRTQLFADYFVNTCSFCYNKKAIIVTDDTSYLKFNFALPSSLVSSEVFIKRILGENHPALKEFILNKYIGYSPSFEQLKEEFELHLNGNENNYEFCIKNINPGIFSIVLDFLVYIGKRNMLSEEIKSKEIEFIISSLFQSFNNTKIVEGFVSLINLKYNELQDKEIYLLNKSLKNVLEKLNF